MPHGAGQVLLSCRKTLTELTDKQQLTYFAGVFNFLCVCARARVCVICSGHSGHIITILKDRA
jgi:hypothetical protein